MESECFFLGEGGGLRLVGFPEAWLEGLGGSFGFFLLGVLSGVGVGDGSGGLVGDSAVGVGVGADFIIILLKLISQFTKVSVILIKFITVPDDFTDVGVELSGRGVGTPFEVLLDRLQVHRLLYYFEVVGDVQSYRVHWLLEGP